MDGTAAPIQSDPSCVHGPKEFPPVHDDDPHRPPPSLFNSHKFIATRVTAQKRPSRSPQLHKRSSTSTCPSGMRVLDRGCVMRWLVPGLRRFPSKFEFVMETLGSLRGAGGETMVLIRGMLELSSASQVDDRSR